MTDERQILVKFSLEGFTDLITAIELRDVMGTVSGPLEGFVRGVLLAVAKGQPAYEVAGHFSRPKKPGKERKAAGRGSPAASSRVVPKKRKRTK